MRFSLSLSPFKKFVGWGRNTLAFWGRGGTNERREGTVYRSIYEVKGRYVWGDV